jgi:hypothetical protein
MIISPPPPPPPLSLSLKMVPGAALSFSPSLSQNGSSCRTCVPSSGQARSLRSAPPRPAAHTVLRAPAASGPCRRKRGGLQNPAAGVRGVRRNAHGLCRRHPRPQNRLKTPSRKHSVDSKVKAAVRAFLQGTARVRRGARSWAPGSSSSHGRVCVEGPGWRNQTDRQQRWQLDWHTGMSAQSTNRGCVLTVYT